jgi:hypothetical protein
MRFIVRCLLRGSAFEHNTLIATPFFAGWSYFSRGKLSIVLDTLNASIVSSSTFISDSLDDTDLLAAARVGLLIEPQGALFRAADHLYIPLRYTARAKYPLLYLCDQLLFVDLLLAVLATSRDFNALLHELVVVPFFLISLMSVYELGYFENDMVAAGREQKPTLTENVERFRSFPIQYNAWIWAVALGATGAMLAYHLELLPSVGVPLGSWIVALIVIRATFFVYNRRPAGSRITLYSILQFEKYAAIFVVLPPTLPGSILALSQMATMSVIYIVYRLGGNKTLFDRELFRFMLFIAGSIVLAANHAIDFSGSLFCFSAISIWFAFRFCTPLIKSSFVARRLRPAKA